VFVLLSIPVVFGEITSTTVNIANYTINSNNYESLDLVYTSDNGNSARLKSKSNPNNRVSFYAFNLNNLDEETDYEQKLTHWWPKILIYLYNDTIGRSPSKDDFVSNATVDGMTSYIAVGRDINGVLCAVAAWPTSDGQSVLGAVISWDSDKAISYVLKSIKVSQSTITENQAKERNPNVGELLYADDFSGSAPKWDTGRNQNVSVTYENGRMHIDVIRNHTKAWASLPGDKVFGNFMIEVEASKENGMDRSAYGVFLRRIDKENYYRFKISGLGQYGFEKNLNGKWINIIPWTNSSAIRTGNATNLIRVECSGDKFAFYVNNEKLRNCTDNSFAAGSIGFEVATFEMGMVLASFDDLKVWELYSEAASTGQIQIERGATLSEQSNYDGPTKALRKPINLNQSAAVALHKKSATLQELGQTAAAEQAFASARELGYNG
jgi:hypothetical protein